MSRIGKLPIAVPGGVDVTLDGQNVSVKGPKGSQANSRFRAPTTPVRTARCTA